MDELGQSIYNICSLVPKGVVIFLPSYTFLDQILLRWKASGLLERLGMKKKVFNEPRKSGEVEMILREYTAANSDQSNVSSLSLIFACG